MPEYLGNIEIPEITPSGVFPIVSDFGWQRIHAPQVITHRFGSANAKIEQRFLIGSGAKRFTVVRRAMNEADRAALRDFWETTHGGRGAFTYDVPSESGDATTSYTVRFENAPLSWEHLAAAVASFGVTLIEIPDTNPSYTVNSTQTRFPSGSLATGLLPQAQELIPLVKLTAREAGYPVMYMSDRRCVVGGQQYLARLLRVDGIGQTLGGESDQATFTFGNADRVMRDLVNDVNLRRATVEFSLFHVATGIKLDLWKGEALPDGWAGATGPEFTLRAAEGIAELRLPYPTRKVQRSCWKDFDNGGSCPFSTANTGLDTTHFPSADGATCDKGYDTPNGCLAHGMKLYFGGVLAEPQAVRIRDTRSGQKVTSTSQVADSIYGQVIPEIYTGADMPVRCLVAAGRDESDFYNALLIIGEGPLELGTGHTLDGQYNHGWPGLLGLRYAQGFSPALEDDLFSLGQSGHVDVADWRKVFKGASTYKDNFSDGLAFLELKRKDEKGIQLTRLGQHFGEAIVSRGLQGWIWSGAGARELGTLTNPVWIVVNMLLRARGLRDASAAVAEEYFDVAAAVAAAAICDQSATKLVPTDSTDTETQFEFRGVLAEQKPLRDWLDEVLANCLGYYTYSFGKLKIGIRVNSSAVEAWTTGNILFQSLQLAPIAPRFNHLEAQFADEEFGYVTNAIELYDMDAAKQDGGVAAPLFLKQTLNLAGTPRKSQAARVVITTLREELGGVDAAEQLAARRIAFRTSILGLHAEPGMVCSLTHDDMPGGAGEFRVTRWRLNPDYSVDIEGQTTTDAMYDYTVGPKPADVEADAIPEEISADVPVPTIYSLTTNLDGWVRYSFTVPEKANYDAIDVRFLVDDPKKRSYGGGESLTGYTLLDGALSDSALQMVVNDASCLTVGKYATVGREIVFVLGPGTTGEAPTSNTVDIARSQLGTQPGAWDDNATVRALEERKWVFPVAKGWTRENEGQTWEHEWKPGAMSVLYAAVRFSTPASTVSLPLEMPLAEFGLGALPATTVAGMLPGFLVLDGDLEVIQIPGFLREGDDLAAPLAMRPGAIGLMYATTVAEPLSAAVQFNLRVDGITLTDSLFGPTVNVQGEIPASDLGSGVFYVGTFLGQVGARELTLDFTQAGSEDGRGEDFTLWVRR